MSSLTDAEMIQNYLSMNHNQKQRARLRSNKALDFKAIAKRRSNLKYQEKNKDKIKEQKAQYYKETKLKMAKTKIKLGQINVLNKKLKKQGIKDGKDKD